MFGSHQLLVSPHLWGRDKMLRRALLSGGVWNGFLLSKSTDEDIRCRFCDLDGDGHLFWECPCPAPNVFFTQCPDVFFGLAGSRARVPARLVPLGQSLLVIWLVTNLT